MRLYATIAAAAFLILLGFASAWHIQGLKLDAVNADFAGFKDAIKAQGEAAQQIADSKAKEDKRRKEASDALYKSTLAALRADAKRLRNQRSRTDFVPAAGAAASRPDIACFDRTQLESAIRSLDTGVQAILDEGDEDALALRIAREWAAERR